MGASPLMLFKGPPPQCSGLYLVMGVHCNILFFGVLYAVPLSDPRHAAPHGGGTTSIARSTAQAPAPAREHGHFVHVCINTSKTTAPSETRGPSITYTVQRTVGLGTTNHPETVAHGIEPPPKLGG